MTNTKLYKVALYIRLSREDGDNIESESVANQRTFLHTFLKCHPKQFKFYNEYIDDGYTGSNFQRPAWQQLISDLKQKKINTIITKDLSRMGRDYISMGQYIERIFPEQNIRYIAINDDIDTLYETPGLEFLQFKLMFNDYFLKDTSKKIRKIVKSKKENGQFLGWKAPYGYIKDPQNKHHLLVDENVKDIVVRMFDLALQGKSPRQIAYIFSQEQIPPPSTYAKKGNNNLWCPRTIGDMLANQTYVGNLTQGKRKKINYKSKKEIRMPKEEWIIVPNTHEAIIDPEVFKTVQNLLMKKQKSTATTHPHLLSGFLICKECGHAIGINRSSDHQRNYCHCTYYTANSKYHLCTPHCLNYDKLETTILSEIRKMVQKYVNVSNFQRKVEAASKENNLKTQNSQKIKHLVKKIATNNSYLDQLYEDKLNKNIDLNQFKRLSLKYKMEIQKYLKIIKTLKKDSQKLENIIPDNISNKINEYLSLNNPKKNFLVHLIDKILISEDKTIEIYYKFKLQ